MKKRRYSEEQIAFALQEAEQGTPVAEIYRKLEVAEQTYYRWKKKYGEMLPSDKKRLKQRAERRETQEVDYGYDSR